MKNVSRVSFIDWAKVICIWLMVVCHAGQKGILLDIIYQFHMPAFLIISGILFRPKGIVKTLKSFGVPIWVFGLITLFFRLIINILKAKFSIETLHDYSEIIVESFFDLVTSSSLSWFQGCWFVIALLAMRILMESKILRQYKIYIGVVCMFWCCIEPYFYLPNNLTELKFYHIISCMPFFITGMIIKEKKFDFNVGSLELCFITFILFIILTFIQGRVDLAGYFYGKSYLLMYLNALIGSWLLFRFCKLLPYRGYVQTLSNGTFLILGLHGIMYGYFMTGLKMIGINNPYLPMLVGFLVMLFLYPFIKMAEKHYPLLLGKVH